MAEGEFWSETQARIKKGRREHRREHREIVTKVGEVVDVLKERDATTQAQITRLLALISALETFIKVTQEYPMSGKQYEALSRIEALR